MKRIYNIITSLMLLAILGIVGTSNSYAGAPTVQGRSISFQNITTTGVKISWINGNGTGRLVVVFPDATITEETIDAAVTNGTIYTGNTAYGTNQIGTSGGYAVYRGTGSTRTVTITDLVAGNTYNVKVYEYKNDGGTDPEFLKSAGSTNNPRSFTTDASILPPTELVNGTATSTSIAFSFTASAGAAGYELDVDEDADVFNSLLQDYDDLDIGNDISFTVVGLANNTAYIYRLRAYVGNITSDNSSSETMSTLNDFTAPTVTSVGVSDEVISESDAGATFTVTLTFDEDMDMDIDPVITFFASMVTTLTLGAGEWQDQRIYIMNYTIADVNASSNFVAVKVNTARDLAGNLMAQHTAPNKFGVDMIKPTVYFIALNPLGTYELISREDIGVDNFTVEIYFELMNTLVAPTISYSADYSTLFTNGSGVWSSWDGGDIYTMTYDVADVPFTVADVDITVTLAQDAVGNVMASDAAAGLDILDIDMVAPTAVSAPDFATTGGTSVNGYYNISNTGVTVGFTVPNEVDGKYTLEIYDHDILGWVDETSNTDIPIIASVDEGPNTNVANNQAGEVASIVIAEGALIAYLGEGNDGHQLYFRVKATDAAGNDTEGDESNKRIIDVTAPATNQLTITDVTIQANNANPATVLGADATALEYMNATKSADGNLAFIRVNATSTDVSIHGGDFKIQYSTNDGTSWTTLKYGDEVDAVDREFNIEGHDITVDGSDNLGLALLDDDDDANGVVYSFRVVYTDRAGNAHVDDNTTSTETIVKDIVVPTVTSLNVNSVGTDAVISRADIVVKFDVIIRFSESMNTGVAPTITYSGDYGLLFINPGGAWSQTTVPNDTYTMTYDVDDLSYNGIDVDITLNTAQDAAGNVMASDAVAGLDILDIDMVAPTAVAAPDFATTGGTLVTGYYNSTNTGVTVGFTVPNEVGGKYTLQIWNNDILGWVDETSNTDIPIIASVDEGPNTNVANNQAGEVASIALTDFNWGLSISFLNAYVGEGNDGNYISFRVNTTDAAGNSTDGIASNIRIVDETAPTVVAAPAFATTGGTLVTGYYNISNTGVTIGFTVPDEVSGSYTLQIRDGASVWVNVASNIAIPIIENTGETANNEATDVASIAIAEGDLSDFLGVANDGNSIYFRVNTTDAAGNSTDGTISNTRTVDETAPTVVAAPAFATTGGTLVTGYYNSTNTGVTVGFTVPNEVGGSYTLQIWDNKNNEWDNETSNTDIPIIAYLGVGNAGNNQEGEVASIALTDFNWFLSISFLNAYVGAVNDYNEIRFRVNATDAAGNSTEGTISNTRTVDETAPTVVAAPAFATTGGTLVTGYYNSTNTGVTVGFTVPDEVGGSYTLQIWDGASVWVNVASNIAIPIIANTGANANNEATDVASIAIAEGDLSDFLGVANDGNSIYFRVNTTDAAGNSTEGTISNTRTVDETAPTVSSTTENFNTIYDANVGAGNFTLTVTFSEAMDASNTPTIAFTQDISSTLTFASGAWPFPINYIATYNVSDANVTVTGVDISSVSGATDLAGNANAAFNENDAFNIDTENPTVTSFTRLTPTTTDTPTNADVVTFRVTFSESVQNVETTDFAITVTGDASGIVASVSSATGTVIDVTVDNIAGDGTLRLDLNANTFGDLAGNATSAYTGGETFTIDNTAPTVVSIERLTPTTLDTPTNLDDVTFRVTFSEAVTGVESTDFTIDAATVTGSAINGTVSAFSTSVYDVTVNTIAGNGTISIDFTDVVTDLAGNDHNGDDFTGGQTFTIDNIAPTVTITRNAVTLGAIEGTTDNTVSFDIVFSEQVLDFDFTGITVNVSGAATFSLLIAGNLVIDNLGGGEYTLTVTGVAGDGTLGITINNAAFTDLAGNALANNAISPLFTIDNTLPTVVIERNAVTLGAIEGTTDNTVSFDIDFSEEVTDFDVADITVNVSGVTFDAIDGDDYAIDGDDLALVDLGNGEYTLTVTGVAGDGTLGITINNAAFTDLAGNALTINAVSDLFTIDNTDPVISGVTFNNPNTLRKVGDEIVATVELNGDESGGTFGTLTINGVTATGAALTFNNPNTTFTATYTIVEGDDNVVDNALTYSITFTDAAGNADTYDEIDFPGDDSPAIDANSPTAANVSALTSIGGTVVSNFYNGSNTSVSFQFTLPNDATLVGGTYTVQFTTNNGSNWANLNDYTTNLITVANGDEGDDNIGEVGKTNTISLTELELTTLSGGTLEDGEILNFRAILVDFAGNTSVDGAPNATGITVAQNGPNLVVTADQNTCQVQNVAFDIALTVEDAAFADVKENYTASLATLGVLTVNSVTRTGTGANLNVTIPTTTATNSYLLTVTLTDVANNTTTDNTKSINFSSGTITTVKLIASDVADVAASNYAVPTTITTGTICADGSTTLDFKYIVSVEDGATETVVVKKGGTTLVETTHYTVNLTTNLISIVNSSVINNNVFTVELSGSFACGVITSGNLTATKNPLPTAAVLTDNSTTNIVCYNSSVAFTADGGNTAGFNYTWEKSTDGGTDYTALTAGTGIVLSGTGNSIVTVSNIAANFSNPNNFRVRSIKTNSTTGCNITSSASDLIVINKELLAMSNAITTYGGFTTPTRNTTHNYTITAPTQGTATSYEWRVANASNEALTTEVIITAITTALNNNINFSNSIPLGTYYVQARAVGACNTGAWPAATEGLAVTITPSPSSAISFTSVTQTSMVVGWTNGSYDGNILLGVQGGSTTLNGDMVNSNIIGIIGVAPVNPSLVWTTSTTGELTFAAVPTAGVNYVADQVGTSNIEATITGLLNRKRYTFRIVDFTGGATKNTRVYNNLTSAITNSRVTSAKEGIEDEFSGVGTTNTISAISPNPAKDFIAFDMDLLESANVTIIIHSLEGREVMRFIDGQMFGAGKHNINIPLKDFISGAYGISISFGNEAIFETFMVTP